MKDKKESTSPWEETEPKNKISTGEVSTVAAEPVVTLMYVGPTLRNPMPLQRGAVYANGLPPILKKAVAEDPFLAALFIPLREAGAALRQLEAYEAGQAVEFGDLLKNVKAVAAKYATKG